MKLCYSSILIRKEFIIKQIEEMSLKKSPAIRRNSSEEKMIKAKECSLPTLFKQQQFSSTPQIHKRFNPEPFKLRVNNAQEKRIENAQETSSKEVKKQKELFVSEEKEKKDFISKGLDKQTHISNNVIQNIFEMFQKRPRPTLTKRKTLAYGQFVQFSDRSNYSCNQSICESSEQKQGLLRRRPIKKISRKFSLTTIAQTNTTQLKEVGIVNRRSNFCTKEAKKQMQRILFYHDFLRKQAELHDLDLNSMNNYEDQVIHYSLGKGNNRQIVKDCMNRRWWWKEAKPEKGDSVNFLWTKLKDRPFIIKNQRLSYQASTNVSLEAEESHNTSYDEQELAARTLHNHFQNNKYLGSKVSLCHSLKTYCQQHNQNISDIILPTFYVCHFMDDQWKSFTRAYFQRLQISRIDNWDVNINKKYWMVKQISRGQVTNRVFMTYKEIKQQVERQCKNGSCFLIQKYISRPFLFKRRKFDIRTYALIVRLKDKINVYLHKEGVISTATELFDMIEIDSPLIHITTEAVQITSKKFGEYEPGNKVDFHAFQNYLDAAFGDKFDFMGQAFPRMQQAVALFVRANCSRLAHSKQNSCFQLIQCEFSMDQDFRPWLIDVHTNPSLDTYCVALERVLPLVIEDTLKYTVDVLFPPPLQWPQQKRHLLSGYKEHHDGYKLIFEEGKEGKQRREVEDIEGVQSALDEQEDQNQVEDLQNGYFSHFVEMDYLLNQPLQMD